MNRDLLHLPTVKYYRVVKQFDGGEKPVAFHLTRRDAEIFIAAAKTKIRIEDGPNDYGENYFEIARFRMEEDHNG